MKRSLVGNDNVYSVQFSIVFPSDRVPIGEYTMIVEFYCDNVDDNTDIILSGSGVNIDLEHMSRFSNDIKKRVIFQREQNIGNTSPRLFITFQYNLDGSPISQNLFQNADAVVYGVKGMASNIPATVYDPLMVVENSSIAFNTNVNFNNHLLQNVPDPQSATDGANKRYIDNIGSSLDSDIVSLDTKISANRTQILNIITWLQTHHGFRT